MNRTSSTIAIAFAALVLAVGCNEAPTVDAGDDFEAVVGQTVEFTPTGMDEDDDLLEYEWRFVSIPDGSDAVLMDTDRPYAFFVADVVGEYVAEVVNFDDGDRSEPDTVTVTVREAPDADIADVAAAVLPGETITLDAAASTVAPGRSVVYEWTLVSAPEDDPDTDEDEGSDLEISEAMAAMESIDVTLDVVGEYVFELTAADGGEDDGTVFDSSARVTVFARTPPVARITSTVAAIVGEAFALDSSETTAGPGADLTYVWTLVTTPAGSTADVDVDEDAPETASVTPDEAGAYEVTLVVDDGVFESDPVTLSFTAAAP